MAVSHHTAGLGSLRTR